MYRVLQSWKSNLIVFFFYFLGLSKQESNHCVLDKISNGFHYTCSRFFLFFVIFSLLFRSCCLRCAPWSSQRMLYDGSASASIFQSISASNHNLNVTEVFFFLFQFFYFVPKGSFVGSFFSVSLLLLLLCHSIEKIDLSRTRITVNLIGALLISRISLGKYGDMWELRAVTSSEFEVTEPIHNYYPFLAYQGNKNICTVNWKNLFLLFVRYFCRCYAVACVCVGSYS